MDDIDDIDDDITTTASESYAHDSSTNEGKIPPSRQFFVCSDSTIFCTAHRWRSLKPLRGGRGFSLF